VVFLLGIFFPFFLPFGHIGYETQQKISEFFLIHTPFSDPFADAAQCPDYRFLVKTMTQTWPERSLGQTEHYALFGEQDWSALSQTGVSIDETGVVKWRYVADEPYVGIPRVGNWTMYFPLDAGVTVAGLSERIEEFRQKVEAQGFQFSDINDIPFYRYPHGAYAKKFGFVKDGYLYHFTITETEPSSDISEEQSPDLQVHIALNCAREHAELRDIYTSYLKLRHDFTSESTIFFAGMYDRAVKFFVSYPGSPWEHTAMEYYKQTEEGLIALLKVDNFPDCAVFERLQIGKDMDCYRPDKREFGIVSY
jgi:hypothetical protein